jgi:hypothetical protein
MHYVILLYVPTGILVGVSLNQIKNINIKSWPFQYIEGDATKKIMNSLIILATATGFTLGVRHYWRQSWRHNRIHLTIDEQTVNIVKCFGSRVIANDSLAIFGGYPRIFAMAQIQPATRFTVAAFASAEDPNLDFFINDLDESKPKYFMDAPDRFIFQNQRFIAASQVPRLKKIVEADYHLESEFDGAPNTRPVKLYVRNKSTVEGHPITPQNKSR